MYLPGGFVIEAGAGAGARVEALEAAEVRVDVPLSLKRAPLSSSFLPVRGGLR